MVFEGRLGLKVSFQFGPVAYNHFWLRFSKAAGADFSRFRISERVLSWKTLIFKMTYTANIYASCFLCGLLDLKKWERVVLILMTLPQE